MPLPVTLIMPLAVTAVSVIIVYVQLGKVHFDILHYAFCPEEPESGVGLKKTDIITEPQ